MNPRKPARAAGAPEEGPAFAEKRYAVEADYPGFLQDITEAEVQEALEVADAVFGWASKAIRTDRGEQS